MAKLTLLLGLGSLGWLNIFQLYMYIIIPVFKTTKNTSPQPLSQNGMSFNSIFQKHFRAVKTYYCNNGTISALKFNKVFLLDILSS